MPATGSFQKDLSSLALMTWVIFGSGLILILGFSLLVGFAPVTVAVGNVYGYDVTFKVSSDRDGYVAGAVLFGLSGLVSFIMGIVILAARRRSFPDQGLVTATGVVSILGGLIIVSTILSIVLLMRISTVKAHAKQEEPPMQSTTEFQPPAQPA